MLPASVGMNDCEEDTYDANVAGQLESSPCRPVKRHEVFSFTKLQRHESIDLHDIGYDGREEAEEADNQTPPHVAPMSYRVGSVFIDCFVAFRPIPR